METEPQIVEGATVTVEHTRGQATPDPRTRTVTGVVYRDDEGVLRVDSVPLERDEDGYLPSGVVLVSITPPAPAPTRPDIVIYAQSMVCAQATTLTRAARKLINEWADAVEARRLARGVDAEDARPERFEVPVMDRRNTTIGHVTFEI